MSVLILSPVSVWTALPRSRMTTFLKALPFGGAKLTVIVRRELQVANFTTVLAPLTEESACVTFCEQVAADAVTGGVVVEPEPAIVTQSSHGELSTKWMNATRVPAAVG